MRQLALFSALQSSTEGIDTEFKSARGGMPRQFLGVLFRHGQHPGRHHCVGRGRKAHRPSCLSHVNPENRKKPIQINHLLSHGCKTLDS